MIYTLERDLTDVQVESRRIYYDLFLYLREPLPINYQRGGWLFLRCNDGPLELNGTFGHNGGLEVKVSLEALPDKPKVTKLIGKISLRNGNGNENLHLKARDILDLLVRYKHPQS